MTDKRRIEDYTLTELYNKKAIEEKQLEIVMEKGNPDWAELAWHWAEIAEIDTRLEELTPCL